MAGKKYGIDTDEYDRETRDAMDEFVKSEQARDWSYETLRIKYDYLKEVTLKNLPELWPALDFSLTVKTILNVQGIDLPFIGIILGPPSSMKTVAVDLFKGYKHTYYTDNFSARSFVSHLSGKTEKELRKIDLLPKIRNRHFLTPELSAMFSTKEDDLHNVIGMLMRIADGQGFQNDSGAQGHRGYDGKMMFVWTGAAVEIPYKVHKLLSYLGAKLYFFRIPYIKKTEDDFFDRRNDDFHIKKQLVKSALFEYLFYFEMNPDIVIEDEPDAESMIWNGHADDDDDDVSKHYTDNTDGMLPKIKMRPEDDDPEAHRMIIRMAMMLSHLRASINVWDSGNQGTDFNYTFAHIEAASRAIEQMRNFARSHALSQGRLSITTDDIPIVIHTALSTASNERVKLFELLIENEGILTTEIVCKSFDITPPPARKTMTELKAIKLVDDITGPDGYNFEKKIRLKSEFNWFLSSEFKALKDQMFENKVVHPLKEKYPPKKGVKIENHGTTEDNIQDAEELKDNTQSEQKTPLLGGEKTFKGYEKSDNPPKEPNGGHYERKGLTNMYVCKDCELCSVQYVIEQHQCPAWTVGKEQQARERQTGLNPNENEKHKADSGGWLLDK